MSKVASIERIKEIKNHSAADRLELAYVLGWQVVVQKGLYQPNSKVIYVNIDTQLPPDNPSWEFLRQKKFKVKTCRLRGEISQGLILPLETLKEFDSSVDLNQLEEGQDVSDIIGAKHIEKQVTGSIGGQVKSTRPSFIPKTDEENLKNYPAAIEEFKNRPFYIKTKLDGSSTSIYYKDGQFGVCSRRQELKEDDTNVFWKVARKYLLEEKLREFGKNIAVVGETCGPKIQGNPLKLSEVDLFVFDILDIDNQRYFDYSDLRNFCVDFELKTPDEVLLESELSLDNLQELANNLHYQNGSPAEGIVIRPMRETFSEVLKGRLSGKVVNQNYRE